MEWYFIVAAAVAAVVVLLILIVFLRAAAFKPRKEKVYPDTVVKCDEQKAISDLAAMIRCKTVSDTDETKEDFAEFEKFEALLPELFPQIYKTCELIRPSKKSLLFRWKGKDSSRCRVLMAHYDVVSVEESLWTKPAFEGVIEDGVLWGRGTLDTKGTLNGVMQAVEQKIKEGFVPENDVYLAFSGNEETNGYGAPAIVVYFKEKGIRPVLVCDEGGAVVENVFPGVKEPCALVGIAEKGLCNIRFSVQGKKSRRGMVAEYGHAVGGVGVFAFGTKRRQRRSARFRGINRASVFGHAGGKPALRTAVKEQKDCGGAKEQAE